MIFVTSLLARGITNSLRAASSHRKGTSYLGKLMTLSGPLPSLLGAGASSNDRLPYPLVSTDPHLNFINGPAILALSITRQPISV